MNNRDICDVLRREINIVDYARHIGLTPIETPSWRNATHRLKEHDSVRINADENTFYRFSNGVGGGIIDFCMEFGDGRHSSLTQSEAIRHLRKVLQGWTPEVRPMVAPMKRKEKVRDTEKFELPPRGKDNKRLFAYLVKTRCLDAELVGAAVKDKTLYQDDRGNVVFCGRDYDGVLKNGAKRTTNTEITYRGDVAGSNKEIGFSVGLVDGQTPRFLFVAESPIDALSLATLVKRCEKPPLEECAFLSVNGISQQPLSYHLDRHPQIECVYLCHDNDERGNMARQSARLLLQDRGFKGKVIDKPSKKKDFNEDLCAVTRMAQEKKQEREKQLINERGIQHEIQ